MQLKNHRVRHELWFINEHEKASVTDFFIPEHRGHREKITTLRVSYIH